MLRRCELGEFTDPTPAAAANTRGRHPWARPLGRQRGV